MEILHAAIMRDISPASFDLCSNGAQLTSHRQRTTRCSVQLQATNMPSPSNDLLRMNRSNSPPLEPTGERMVPESSDRFTFWEHVYRYAFATRFVRGKRVLDIACGE